MKQERAVNVRAGYLSIKEANGGRYIDMEEIVPRCDLKHFDAQKSKNEKTKQKFNKR